MKLEANTSLPFHIWDRSLKLYVHFPHFQNFLKPHKISGNIKSESCEDFGWSK